MTRSGRLTNIRHPVPQNGFYVVSLQKFKL